MAAGLVFAIAAHREIRLARKGRQQAVFGFRHLGAISTDRIVRRRRFSERVGEATLRRLRLSDGVRCLLYFASVSKLARTAQMLGIGPKT